MSQMMILFLLNIPVFTMLVGMDFGFNNKKAGLLKRKNPLFL